MDILNVLLLKFLEHLKYTTTIQNEKTKFKRVQMVDDSIGGGGKAISLMQNKFSASTQQINTHTHTHTKQGLFLKQ